MTTQTTTLADFLLARIADEEAAWSGGTELATRPEFARLSKHMLAECAAKRRLIDLWSEWDRLCSPGEWPESGDLSQAPMADAARFMLRTLVKVYAHHPDFREEWRA